MRLEEIMTRNVWSIAPDADAEVAWQMMRKTRIHHLVVMEGSQILGILSERDVGGTRGDAVRKGRAVAELMSTRPVVAAPETTVRQAANLLRGRSIGCLPVVDGKTLVGIVTTTDLLELLGRTAAPPARAPPRRRKDGATAS